MNTEAAEVIVQFTSYAVLLTYMYDHGMDFYNDDDVKDAMVEMAAETEHFTDAELDEGVTWFRNIRAEINV